MNTNDGIRVIVLSGELEIGRRDEITSALRVAAGDHAILVDFSQATYADSTTLAALLALRAETIKRRIPLALIIATRQFMRLIQYAGLGELFAIFEDRAAALTHLGDERHS